jgi:6,7-dimethyl-8-ribityllumazine synthase
MPQRPRRRAKDSARALVVVSRFNEAVTRKLLEGASAELHRSGFGADAIDIAWVPGAFELPVAVHVGLQSGRYRIAVALGAVIRGDTPHFEYISAEATRGLGEAAIRFGIPVGFGLLTCDTLEQAIERAGGAAGNKGTDAAAAAVQTERALEALGRVPGTKGRRAASK